MAGSGGNTAHAGLPTCVSISVGLRPTPTIIQRSGDRKKYITGLETRDGWHNGLETDRSISRVWRPAMAGHSQWHLLIPALKCRSIHLQSSVRWKHLTAPQISQVETPDCTASIAPLFRPACPVGRAGFNSIVLYGL